MLHDPTLWERFFSKIESTNSCWWWGAARNDRGYGQIQASGRVQYAHRVAWELLVGPIPEGLEIDHLCRNTLCVNPDHLQPVTRSENLRRGSGKFTARARSTYGNRTHCSRGHEYTPENTYILKGGTHRYCRACVNARNRARRAAARNAA